MQTSDTKRPKWHRLPATFRQTAAAREGSVLLETASPQGTAGKSFLFRDPTRVLEAFDGDDVSRVLAEVDELVKQGYFVAGWLGYECGEALVGLAPVKERRQSGRQLWLGVYRERVAFDHASGQVEGVLPEGVRVERVREEHDVLRAGGLKASAEEYATAFAMVQEHLSAGDTYQVNLTTKVEGVVLASPLEVYDEMLRRQPVPFAAYVHLAEETVLSFSPELFYRVEDGTIVVRPMKGTWPRGVDAEGDLAAAGALRADEKNRAEHIMIVDLLRNDLGRVAKRGSVHVERLMDVERYATLLQMTSTITAEVRDEVTPSEVFRSMFPSGSITGAPKRSTMEIIRKVESEPRGVYTGAIGYFAPGGEACFNVAIRTMRVRGNAFEMGVGGGVTADSTADDEYRECALKAAFLTRAPVVFSLIETMRCAGEIALLEEHLRRLAASAAYFGWEYDEGALRAAIASACGSLQGVSRVRLELHRDGTWDLQCSAPEEPVWSGRVLLSATATRSDDVFLHHKTTHRAFYNDALSNAVKRGFGEVLFLNEAGHLTEGAISNVFVQTEDAWFTPSLSCGVLPGVMREVLLAEWNATESDDLSLEMLQRAQAIAVCNGLRGVRVVTSVVDETGAVVWSKSD